MTHPIEPEAVEDLLGDCIGQPSLEQSKDPDFCATIRVNPASISVHGKRKDQPA